MVPISAPEESKTVLADPNDEYTPNPRITQARERAREIRENLEA